MELLVLSQVVKRLLCPPSKGQQCLAYSATAVLTAASPLSPAVPCCGRSLLSLSVALLCYQLTAPWFYAVSPGVDAVFHPLGLTSHVLHFYPPSIRNSL